MPLNRFLMLIGSVLVAAAVTVALAFGVGIDFGWFGLAAILLAVAVRKWV
jgi:uncharacterized membrane protein YbjE (DUF340 family)